MEAPYTSGGVSISKDPYFWIIDQKGRPREEDVSVSPRLRVELEVSVGEESVDVDEVRGGRGEDSEGGDLVAHAVERRLQDAATGTGFCGGRRSSQV